MTHQPSVLAREAGRRIVDVRCHRRLRGPYTGGGALLRVAVPEVAAAGNPDLKRLATAVVAITPDLEGAVPPRPQTLTDLAQNDERTRFYPVQRTRDLSYMVSEILRLWVRECHPEGVVLRMWDLAEADPTDLELVATLRRRLDPATSEVVDAGRFAVAVPEDPFAAARAYVEADGTSHEAALVEAYRALPEAQRAALHSARAAALIDANEPGTQLGAIPYHLENGSDPASALPWFVEGQNQAFREGCYESALDLGRRGRRLAPWADNPKIHNYLTKRVIGALTYLSRCDEAIEVIVEHRSTTTEISEQMNDAYMMAMIYTRHLPKDQLDQDQALAWINTALAIADAEPNTKKRAFYRAFMRNARALVELHRGNISGSFDLVQESIAIADEHLGTGHELHRTVLLTNRARVWLALGEPEAALAAFDEVLTRDPEYDDPYFERSCAHRSVGDLDAALRDLDRAIELSLAFTEAYYNRADIMADRGEVVRAIADLSMALDVEPGYVDARLNRAVLLLESGDLAAAWEDLRTGLGTDPEHAELLQVRAQWHVEAGDPASALADFDSALRHKPDLVAAYVNRSIVHYEAARYADAVADLDRAIALGDQPRFRVNRGIARQAAGDSHGAALDFEQALTSPDDVDVDDVRARLAEITDPQAAGEGDVGLPAQRRAS